MKKGYFRFKSSRALAVFLSSLLCLTAVPLLAFGGGENVSVEVEEELITHKDVSPNDLLVLEKIDTTSLLSGLSELRESSVGITHPEEESLDDEGLDEDASKERGFVASSDDERTIYFDSFEVSASDNESFEQHESKCKRKVDSARVDDRNSDDEMFGVTTADDECFGAGISEKARYIDDGLVDTGKRMRVKVSFADCSRLPEGTGVKSLMEDESLIGDCFLFQQEFLSTLYDFGDASYYCSFIDVPKINSIVDEWAVDALFARDNFFGESVEGVKWLRESGIALVPRAYVDSWQKRDDELYCLQAQLLSLADKSISSKEVSFPLSVVNTTTCSKLETRAVGSLISGVTHIQLVDEGRADSLDTNSIVASLNNGAMNARAVGSNSSLAKRGQAIDSGTNLAALNAVSYDNLTGVLTLNVPPMSIMNATVEYASETDVAVAQEANVRTGISDIDYCGAVFDKLNLADCKNLLDEWFVTWTCQDTSGDYIISRDYVAWGPSTQHVSDLTSSTDVERVSASYNYSMSLYNDDDLPRPVDWNGGESWRHYLIDNPDYAINRLGTADGFGSPNEQLQNFNWHFQDPFKVRFYPAVCCKISTPFDDRGSEVMPTVTKVLGVDEEEQSITLGFVSSKKPGNPQNCCFVLKFKVDSFGKISLKKAISVDEGDKANELFSVANAEYGVWRDEAHENFVATLTTDAEGVATSEELPSGTYWVQETSAPAGLTLSPNNMRVSVGGGKTSIVADSETPEGDSVVSEDVLRGDLKLKKIRDVDGAPLAGIPFRLVLIETGECHVLVTDENGEIDTSSTKVLHSENTNENDGAKIFDNLTNSGVWFFLGDGGGVNDAKGALPYGSYRLEEIACAANEGLELVTIDDIKISEDSFRSDDGIETTTGGFSSSRLGAQACDLKPEILLDAKVGSLNFVPLKDVSTSTAFKEHLMRLDGLNPLTEGTESDAMVNNGLGLCGFNPLTDEEDSGEQVNNELVLDLGLVVDKLIPTDEIPLKQTDKTMPNTGDIIASLILAAVVAFIVLLVGIIVIKRIKNKDKGEWKYPY